MRNKIEQALEEYVRPELAQHGGNVMLIDYENGVVRLKMTGKCANCPAADVTNTLVITKALTQVLPEVRRVELTDAVSEDLLAQARRLLLHQP